MMFRSYKNTSKYFLRDFVTKTITVLIFSLLKITCYVAQNSFQHLGLVSLVLKARYPNKWENIILINENSAVWSTLGRASGHTNWEPHFHVRNRFRNWTASLIGSTKTTTTVIGYLKPQLPVGVKSGFCRGIRRLREQNNWEISLNTNFPGPISEFKRRYLLRLYWNYQLLVTSRLDYQPLSGKGASAPPPNSRRG